MTTECSGGQKSKINVIGLKSRCWNGYTPSEGSRRDPFLVSFSFLWLVHGIKPFPFVYCLQGSLAFLVLQLYHSNLFIHLHITFSSVCGQFSLCLLLIKKCATAFRAYSCYLGQPPNVKMLNLFTSAKTLPSEVTFTGTRDQGQTFWGAPMGPLQGYSGNY